MHDWQREGWDYIRALARGFIVACSVALSRKFLCAQVKDRFASANNDKRAIIWLWFIFNIHHLIYEIFNLTNSYRKESLNLSKNNKYLQLIILIGYTSAIISLLSTNASRPYRAISIWRHTRLRWCSLSMAFFRCADPMADDQRLAGSPPYRPASQSTIVRHEISASERRCG